MQIDEVRIFKYKSITKPRTIKLKPGMSIFIGKNNSGKSTVLDALFRFFRPLQNPERYVDSEARLEIDCLLTQKERSQIAKNGPTKLPEAITLQLNGDTFSYKTEDEQKPLPASLSNFLIQKTIRIGAMRDLDYVKMKKLFDEFQSGWPKAFKLFSGRLQIFFPEIKTPSKLFQEKREGVETTVKEFGEKRSLERLGLGFRQIFLILLYYYHPRYEILLIDEPEIHLHPQMIKRLHSVFSENISNKQILFTTHSTLFIQPQTLSHVFRTNRTEEDGTYFGSLTDDTLDPSRLVQELNADNGEMFLADHVLLVEGISDRIFLRTLLQRWYESSKDIKIIPVHGKENFDLYAQLLDCFKIPYSALFDKDAFSDQSIDIIQTNKKSPDFNIAAKNLHSKGIFILPRGSLEQHYPGRLYAKEIPKPLLALQVSEGLTQEEFTSDLLAPIKRLLDSIV